MDEQMRFMSEFLLATITCVIFTTFVDCPLVNKQIRFDSKFLIALVTCEISKTFVNNFLVVKEEPNVTWSNACDDYILDSMDSFKAKNFERFSFSESLCNIADVERSAINLIRSLSSVQHTHKPLQHRMKNSPCALQFSRPLDVGARASFAPSFCTIYINTLSSSPRCNRTTVRILVHRRAVLRIDDRYIRIRGSCDALLSRTFASTTSTANCKHLTSWLQLAGGDATLSLSASFLEEAFNDFNMHRKLVTDSHVQFILAGTHRGSKLAFGTCYYTCIFIIRPGYRCMRCIYTYTSSATREMKLCSSFARDERLCIRYIICTYTPHSLPVYTLCTAQRSYIYLYRPAIRYFIIVCASIAVSQDRPAVARIASYLSWAENFDFLARDKEAKRVKRRHKLMNFPSYKVKRTARWNVRLVTAASKMTQSNSSLEFQIPLVFKFIVTTELIQVNCPAYFIWESLSMAHVYAVAGMHRS
ncbi:unnamed protein product, partial [Trichogramma brassicae]